MGNWAKAIKINVDVFFFYQILQEHLWMQVLQVDVFLPLLHSFLHPAAPPLQNLHWAHGPLKCNTIRNIKIFQIRHNFFIINHTHNELPRHNAQRPHWEQLSQESRQDLQSPLRQDTVSCFKIDFFEKIYTVNFLLTGIALIDMKKQHRSSPRTSICFIVCIETQNVWRYFGDWDVGIGLMISCSRRHSRMWEYGCISISSMQI